MTEEQAMLAAIVAEPADDTPRLAYADWLEELPAVRKACEKCDGKGGAYHYASDDPGNKLLGGSHWYSCRAMCDDGTVVDTSNADRAEFIRVGCEFERHPFAANIRTGDYDARDGVGGEWVRGFELWERITQLEQAYRNEWFREKCPECGGRGTTNSGRNACRTCVVAGDLLSTTHTANPDDFDIRGDTLCSERRQVTFRRGFLDSVSCTMDEVGRDTFVFDRGFGGEWQWVTTEWAKALLTARPTITKLYAVDRVPEYNPADKSWRFDNWGDLGDYPNYVSGSVLDRMVGNYGHDHSQKMWGSRQEANDALAVAMCRIAKEAIQ